jgi:uncharacterized membrane protein YcaP (DUF421 family)
MPPIDWHGMFVPTISLYELLIRGTALYFAIFGFMRLFRREAGALSMADLLVIVLVADAAQNAMASDYHSITEGVVLVATIFCWNLALDYLSFRFPAVRRVLSPKPLLLIKDGQVNRRHLRAELISRDELIELLREHGIERVSDVKVAYLESDGHVSVIPKQGPSPSPEPPKQVGR